MDREGSTILEAESSRAVQTRFSDDVSTDRQLSPPISNRYLHATEDLIKHGIPRNRRLRKTRMHAHTHVSPSNIYEPRKRYKSAELKLVRSDENCIAGIFRGICLPWKLSACPFVEWYYHSSGEWDIFNEVWGEKSSRGRNWKIKRNIYKSHHISRISLSERDISVDLEYTMKEMKSILNYLKVLLFSKFRVSNIGISRIRIGGYLVQVGKFGFTILLGYR